MGMFKDARESRLIERIEALSEQLAEMRGEGDVLSLTDEIATLKKKKSDLEIERDKRQEDFDRREREITHKVGLEKKRSEFETDAAKKEAVLHVREENLTARQERFEEEMKFQRERFESEVGYLKEMVSEVLERLPTVTVDRKVTTRRK